MIISHCCTGRFCSGLTRLQTLVNCKHQRRQIICSVCHVNHVVYNVTQTVSKGVDPRIWPTVDVGEDKVDRLRHRRLTEVLSAAVLCNIVIWSRG